MRVSEEWDRQTGSLEEVVEGLQAAQVEGWRGYLEHVWDGHMARRRRNEVALEVEAHANVVRKAVCSVQRPDRRGSSDDMHPTLLEPDRTHDVVITREVSQITEQTARDEL